MELNRNLCAFSAGSKALRAGRYNGDAKAIVLCVAHNFHERQRVYFHFYFLFYFRKLFLFTKQVKRVKYIAKEFAKHVY
jgi:hypothetical protein